MLSGFSIQMVWSQGWACPGACSPSAQGKPSGAPPPLQGPSHQQLCKVPTESYALCQARPYHTDPEVGSKREVR